MAKKIETSHQPSKNILIERVNRCNYSSAFLGNLFSRSTKSFQILPSSVTKAEALGWRKPTPARGFPAVIKDRGGTSYLVARLQSLSLLTSARLSFHTVSSASFPRIQFVHFFPPKWAVHVRDIPAVCPDRDGLHSQADERGSSVVQLSWRSSVSWSRKQCNLTRKPILSGQDCDYSVPSQPRVCSLHHCRAFLHLYCFLLHPAGVTLGYLYFPFETHGS